MCFTETNKHHKFPGISAQKRELDIQQAPAGLCGRKTRCFFSATATITTGRFPYFKSNTKPMSTGRHKHLTHGDRPFTAGLKHQSRIKMP